MNGDEGPIGERVPPRPSEGVFKCHPGINGKPGAPGKPEKDGEFEPSDLPSSHGIHKILNYGKHS